jgi:ParB-like chromosome segregation protein Spo0J
LPALLIPLGEIEAQHRVTEPARKRALVRSMKAHGWTGRPIVVADFGRTGTLSDRRYLALNGTHRLAALVDLGAREVPAEVVDVSRWSYADARALDDAVKPADKARILWSRGKKRLARWIFEEGWPEFSNKDSGGRRAA